VLPYAAYLRIYEPLTAFAEPERSRWASYAASHERPRRVSALPAEHNEAMRRVVAVPPIVAPVTESGHAYVRRADGVIYICPWQTRLRSWLALGRLRATLPPALANTFVPRAVADMAAVDFARWHARSPSIRTNILTATWHVPLAWFVPFGPPERWLVLGGGSAGDAGQPTAAAAARMLMYVTTMVQARRRVARALAAVRHGLPSGPHPYPRDDAHPNGADSGPGTSRDARRDANIDAGSEASADASMDSSMDQRPPRRAWTGQRADARPDAQDAVGPPSAAVGEIEEVGWWLAEFHPRSLVELDYGGLVFLLGDEELRSDQSVAEVAAAVTGLETGELELAVALYRRLRERWRPLQATESAS